MVNRRHLIAGALAAPAFSIGSAIAQEATPAVDRQAPTTTAVLSDWLTAQAALSELGNAVTEAFFAADIEAIASVSDAAVGAALANGQDVQRIIDRFTTNQIRFSFSAVDAWFYLQYTPEVIVGHMVQGSAFVFQAAPEEPQTETFPTGTWRGVIGPGVIDLRCLLEFAGTAESPEVQLSIPSQMLANQPMDNVTFQADVPIGERIDERSMPIGGDVIATNIWAAEYEWGGHSLVVNTFWDTEMRMAGLTLSPQPPVLSAVAREPIRCRLPFDGAWLVYWGGETVFANYHTAVAPQRHALDIMIWRNGATSTGTGRKPEEYWCFGQPLLAPVAGTVVHVLDGLEDIQPQAALSGDDHPAGNHIVIETEGGFVYLAHCQQGSIQVAEGDEIVAGDVLALVGNSGNTSEPHIHIHAQTVADFYDPRAVGVPLIFTELTVNGEFMDETPLLYGTIVESA
ncbi:MAG: M23 family metallopeptidase [Thermomicrobiales bacterium]|nr:M23 family metallopeptidase [Thermomicrobiales bacterium]